MFIAALFIIVKNQKEPECPSRGDWLHKLQYIHTVKYCVAIRKNKWILLNIKSRLPHV